jgi:AraC-like DNA-binding protein
VGQGIPAYLYLRRAKDLIDRHYAEPLTVSELAREAFASEAHFSRSFKRAFGETPARYLVQRRLERAKELLRGTTLTVTEVCFEAGFQSLGSFSSAFHRDVGESPSAYRERWRRAGPPSVPACYGLMWTRPTRAVWEKPTVDGATSVAGDHRPKE